MLGCLNISSVLSAQHHPDTDYTDLFSGRGVSLYQAQQGDARNLAYTRN